MLEYLIWSLILVWASLASAAIFVRRRLIRRTYRDGPVAAFSDLDHGRSLLADLDDPGWSCQITDGSLEAKGWKVSFQSQGARRLYFIYKYCNVLQMAKRRWEAHRGAFYALHFCFLSVLFVLASLKGIFAPSPDDCRMLIGLDSFAAARLIREQERVRLLQEGAADQTWIS